MTAKVIDLNAHGGEDELERDMILGEVINMTRYAIMECKHVVVDTVHGQATIARLPDPDGKGTSVWISYVSRKSAMTVKRFWVSEATADWIRQIMRKNPKKRMGLLTVPGAVTGRAAAKSKSTGPKSVYEVAREESGLEGEALRKYVSRHYGHD